MIRFATLVGFIFILCGHASVALAQEELSLAKATELALSNRPSILAAEERVSAAQDREREMGLTPPMRLEFGYETRPDLGIGNDLFLAIPVDLFGKARSLYLVAHADLLTAKAGLSQSALDLQTEVFTSYSELITAQYLVSTGQQLVDLAQKSYDATQRRIAAGDLPPNQQLRADLELRKAKQVLASRRHVLESATKGLASTLAIPVNELGAIQDKLPITPPVGSAEDRPDISASKAILEAGRASQSVARTSNAPDVEFEFARDYWDNPGRVVGRIQVAWNFFDYGAGKSRRSGAGHTSRAARLGLKDMITQAKDQIMTSKLELDSAQEESASYSPLVKDAEDLLNKEENAFGLGASSLLDVIDASRSLRDLQETAIEVRARAIVAEGKYLAATGTLIGKLPARKGR